MFMLSFLHAISLDKPVSLLSTYAQEISSRILKSRARFLPGFLSNQVEIS